MKALARRSFLALLPTVLIASRASQAGVGEQARHAPDRIARHAPQLFRDAEVPAMGRADAAIVLVEFFDYNCPFCKAIHEDLRTLVNENADVRLVLKDLAILREDSQLPARIALAAHTLGQYLPVHAELMKHRGPYTGRAIIDAVERAGADPTELRRRASSPEVNRMFTANKRLAEALEIQATPTFILRDRIIVGGLSKAELLAAVLAERGPRASSR